jgi:hypothetical protein
MRLIIGLAVIQIAVFSTIAGGAETNPNCKPKVKTPKPPVQLICAPTKPCCSFDGYTRSEIETKLERIVNDQKNDSEAKFEARDTKLSSLDKRMKALELNPIVNQKAVTIDSACPIYVVLIGLILGFGSVILRTILFTSRKITLDKKYYGLIGLSLLGSAVGSWGYHDLISGNVDTATDYSQILSVLSLLAAGIITGFFTFTFTHAAEDERVLASAISACFVLLFYIVFAALSFYMGKSPHIHRAAYSNIVGPLIMWLLLVANTLFDFWDYREEPKV